MHLISEVMLFSHFVTLPVDLLLKRLDHIPFSLRTDPLQSTLVCAGVVSMVLESFVSGIVLGTLGIPVPTISLTSTLDESQVYVALSWEKGLC